MDKGGSLPAEQKEYRPVRLGHLKQLDVHNIPQGTISIIEALTLLHDHQQMPKIWTVEKIAEEYSLELKDVTAVITHFTPFSVVVTPPKERKDLDHV